MFDIYNYTMIYPKIEGMCNHQGVLAYLKDIHNHICQYFGVMEKCTLLMDIYNYKRTYPIFSEMNILLLALAY